MYSRALEHRMTSKEAGSKLAVWASALWKDRLGFAASLGAACRHQQLPA